MLLKNGSKSGKVKELQQKLKDLHYYVGKIDGIFGPKTESAVHKFQTDNKLKIDGVVGDKTWAALDLLDACKKPTENYPYSDETFAMVKSIAPLVLQYSSRLHVPPVAVAGSIADEYNTRRGIKLIVDWFQDEILLNWMPNIFIELDAKIAFQSKLLNATKHDIGIGNIKLETAKEIYKRYKYKITRKNLDYSDIVDYMRTDEGTVYIVSLVIKKASQDLASYVNGYSAEKKEAVYVTYYKQGSRYIQRFKNNPSKDPNRTIEPGEGCRVWFQRNRFLEILGVR